MTTKQSRPRWSSWLDIRTPAGRRMCWVSDACVLFAVVVFAVTVGTGWWWPPFIGGAAVGVAGVAAYRLQFPVLAAALGVSAQEAARGRAQVRDRDAVIIPGYLTYGVVCGVIGGSVGSWWPVIALAAGVVLFTVVVPLTLLPVLKRRIARKQAAS